MGREALVLVGLTLLEVACGRPNNTQARIEVTAERPYLEKVRDEYPALVRDPQWRALIEQAHQKNQEDDDYQGVVFFNLENTQQPMRVYFTRIDVNPPNLQAGDLFFLDIEPNTTPGGRPAKSVVPFRTTSCQGEFQISIITNESLEPHNLQVYNPTTLTAQPTFRLDELCLRQVHLFLPSPENLPQFKWVAN